jgi:hypothetical protein
MLEWAQRARMPAMKEEEARPRMTSVFNGQLCPTAQAPPASAAAGSEAGVTILAAFAGSIS